MLQVDFPTHTPPLIVVFVLIHFLLGKVLAGERPKIADDVRVVSH